MLRSIGFLAVLLLAGTPLRAGELDAEYGLTPAATPALTPTPGTSRPADVPPPFLARNRADGRDLWVASELDSESPAQAWRHGGWGGHGFGWGGHGFGWGGGGFGRGFGWGGLGWGGWGGGYGLGWGGGYGLGYGGYGLGYGGYGLGYGGYGLGYGGYGLGYGGYGLGYGLLATSYYSPYLRGWGGWGCW